MERMQYVTPNRDSPKGKNHIFFAAHPEDLQGCLQELQHDIFRAEGNCAIWFDAAPNRGGDELLIEDMQTTGIQLFVYPVTARLLRNESLAVNKILPYAQEKNIPILPILLETGLDVMYKRVFGEIQYLDKAAQDETAIPYEEKLARFLGDILVKEETAEKIRAAFDTYIFLSYRKKDRALAADLMRLIHEIPQMRDVAIWYDEFLVPGENFNASIVQALDKSALFAVAVTPNLVSENNYVLSTEYPEAKKTGKPILPVQVAQTDPAAYCKECKEFGEELPGIDAYDSELLQQALLKAFHSLQHITLAKNDDSMHNYLIGLAYLNGIDVEVNPKKALELITDAAQNSCPDAMQTLANMYFWGNVVRRDLERAEFWQRSLIEARKKAYEEKGDFSSKLDYVHAWSGLGDLYEKMHAMSQAAEAYLQAAGLLEEADASDELTVKELRWLCGLWEALAILFHGELDFAQAYEYYTRCINLWERITAEQEDEFHLRRYAGCLNLLGCALMERGNLPAAHELFEKAYQLFTRAAEISYSDFAIRGLAACDTYLGMLHTRGGDFSPARLRLENAVDAFFELAEKTGNPRHYDDLARAQLELGTLLRVSGEYGEAVKAYMIGADIYEEKYSRTGDLSTLQNLSATFLHAAESSLAAGEITEAKGFADKALDTVRQLCQNSHSLGAQVALSKVYHVLGKTSLGEGDVDGAEAYMQKAIEHHQALCSESGSDQLREHLVEMLEERTTVLLRCGEWRAAKRYCRENRRIAEEWLAQGDCVNGYRLLCGTCGCLRKIYKEHLCDLQQEQEQLYATIGWAEKVVEQPALYIDYLYLSDLYDELAERYVAQNRIAEAVVLYQKSIHKLESVEDFRQHAAVRRRCIQEYTRLAGLLHSHQGVSHANMAHDHAVNMSRSLAQDTGDPDDWEILAECLWYTGLLASGVPDKATAEEALQILKELCEMFPKNAYYRERFDYFSRQWNPGKKTKNKRR